MTFKASLLPYDETRELGSSTTAWRITRIKLPTTSGGTAYGPGSANQVLMSNGSTVYWGTSMTPTSHTHGNLTNDGKITTTATIASGDKIVIVDSDTTAASKITGSSITFGSSANYCLANNGTWQAFNNYSHPTTSGNKHIPSGGSSG